MDEVKVKITKGGKKPTKNYKPDVVAPAGAKKSAKKPATKPVAKSTKTATKPAKKPIRIKLTLDDMKPARPVSDIIAAPAKKPALDEDEIDKIAETEETEETHEPRFSRPVATLIAIGVALIVGLVGGMAVWVFTKPKVNQCHIEYDSNGGDEIASKDVVCGSLIPDPGTPEREGHEFQSWLKDGLPVDFTKDKASKNIKIVAKWLMKETDITDSGNDEEEKPADTPAQQPAESRPQQPANNQPAQTPATDDKKATKLSASGPSTVNVGETITITVKSTPADADTKYSISFNAVAVECSVAGNVITCKGKASGSADISVRETVSGITGTISLKVIGNSDTDTPPAQQDPEPQQPGNQDPEPQQPGNQDPQQPGNQDPQQQQGE